MHILGLALFKNRLFLGNYLIFIFQSCQISANLSAHTILNLRTGSLAAGNGRKNRKINPVIFAELLNKDSFTLIQKYRIRPDYMIEHLGLGRGPRINKQLNILRDTACKRI